MKLSSVSPERWLVITPQPASLAMRTASIDSVTDPIWFTCAQRPRQRWNLQRLPPARALHTHSSPRGAVATFADRSATFGNPAACQPHAAH